MSFSSRITKRDKNEPIQTSFRQRVNGDMQSTFLTTNLIDNFNYETKGKNTMRSFVDFWAANKNKSIDDKDDNTFYFFNDLIENNNNLGNSTLDDPRTKRRSFYTTYNQSIYNPVENKTDRGFNMTKLNLTQNQKIIDNKKKYKMTKTQTDFKTSTNLRLNLTNVISPRILEKFSNDLIKSKLLFHQKELPNINKINKNKIILSPNSPNDNSRQKFIETLRVNNKMNISKNKFNSKNNKLLNTEMHNNGTKIFTYSRDFKDVFITGKKLELNKKENKEKIVKLVDRDIQTSYLDINEPFKKINNHGKFSTLFMTSRESKKGNQNILSNQNKQNDSEDSRMNITLKDFNTLRKGNSALKYARESNTSRSLLSNQNEIINHPLSNSFLLQIMENYYKN